MRLYLLNQFMVIFGDRQRDSRRDRRMYTKFFPDGLDGLPFAPPRELCSAATWAKTKPDVRLEVTSDGVSGIIEIYPHGSTNPRWCLWQTNDGRLQLDDLTITRSHCLTQPSTWRCGLSRRNCSRPVDQPWGLPSPPAGDCSTHANRATRLSKRRRLRSGRSRRFLASRNPRKHQEQLLTRMCVRIRSPAGSEEDAQIFGQQDVLVEHQAPSRDFPPLVNPPEPVLPTANIEILLGLTPASIDQ